MLHPQLELDALVERLCESCRAEDVTRYEWLLGREENLCHFMPRLLGVDAINTTELEDNLQRAHGYSGPKTSATRSSRTSPRPVCLARERAAFRTSEVLVVGGRF